MLHFLEEAVSLLELERVELSSVVLETRIDGFALLLRFQSSWELLVGREVLVGSSFFWSLFVLSEVPASFLFGVYLQSLLG